MKLGRYVLVNKIPVPEPDILKWGKWFQEAKERIVSKDRFGDIEVSTVFLALDHNLDDEGPPVLWETMIFGGPLDQYQDRCSGSWEQAEAMHHKALVLVMKEIHGWRFYRWKISRVVRKACSESLNRFTTITSWLRK